MTGKPFLIRSIMLSTSISISSNLLISPRPPSAHHQFLSKPAPCTGDNSITAHLWQELIHHDSDTLFRGYPSILLTDILYKQQCLPLFFCGDSSTYSTSCLLIIHIF